VFFVGYIYIWVVLLVFVIMLGVGILIGYIVRKKISEAAIGSAEQEAIKIIERASGEAESKKKELLLEAKEEGIRIKKENEKEHKERRAELATLEKRLLSKEEHLDKKMLSFEKKEDALAVKSEKFELKTADLQKKIDEQQNILERLSGLTSDEAKSILMASIEEEIEIEASAFIKETEARTKQEADKRAFEIIISAIQRCDVHHIVESTVSVVNLPNDEMKGRIIGREGRNIRAIESLTGVDLIIDDTPEAVVLSGFNAYRREIAKIALEKLISDGRIHPSRIEECVNKATKEVENQIFEEGEAAIFEAGIAKLHPELIRHLGRMKFRTSYGQNVLRHSIEVAKLCGIIADMIGEDVALARRAGLLHDIGKSIDQDNEGTHVSLGADLCRKYKENKIVVNAVEAHHGDVDPISNIAVIVQIADAVSASRPGARKETLEIYINRLKKLEEIADAHKGVDRSFAIQAGRELRVIIRPDEIDDRAMPYLARQIAQKIEKDVEYPGHVKISVVRETRAIEYAK